MHPGGKGPDYYVAERMSVTASFNAEHNITCI